MGHIITPVSCLRGQCTGDNGRQQRQARPGGKHQKVKWTQSRISSNLKWQETSRKLKKKDTNGDPRKGTFTEVNAKGGET
ncbi:hypothetical protein EVAR_96995_1 [Eumeta japonica]|uniref:Uncharacterized protein n=1 Tax=Eumeta variegata TaxID=151549 RepID=A0A4C1VDS0_EUMVA|nr:hypothetical protein EVAR_96995_1 [Eumeta japonica]